MNEADEYTIHLRSRTDKTYVGPSFPTLSGQRLRIANKYIDGEGGYEFATVKDEIVLRTTPGGRFQIKATFVEDDRSFRTADHRVFLLYLLWRSFPRPDAGRVVTAQRRFVSLHALEAKVFGDLWCFRLSHTTNLPLCSVPNSKPHVPAERVNQLATLRAWRRLNVAPRVGNPKELPAYMFMSLSHEHPKAR